MTKFSCSRDPASLQRGFTLTELAVVLIIVSLLIGGMLMPLSAQQDARVSTETTRQLNEIKEALVGFAVVNGYFPCPAISSTDGREDRSGNVCTGAKRKGLLPWVTLGIQPTDGWGYIFMYSVTPAFSNSGLHFSLTSPRDITIQTRDAGGTSVNLTNSNDIPVVIHSTGKNGYWGWPLDSAVANPDSANPNDDEDTNSGTMATGQLLFSRAPSIPTSGNGEFDDIVTWISPNILFSRMIAAGKLP